MLELPFPNSELIGITYFAAIYSPKMVKNIHDVRFEKGEIGNALFLGVCVGAPPGGVMPNTIYY